MVKRHKVVGRRIDMADGRFVFLGTSEDDPPAYYVGFRNIHGEDTKFTLTNEAMTALRELLANPDVGLPVEPFPMDVRSVIQRWTYVVDLPTEDEKEPA